MTSASPAPSLTFPHPVLTPVTDAPPTIVSITTLQSELYENAMAIHTTLGGGTNGHLAVVMPDAAYLTRAGVAFPPPDHPGATAVHAAGATTVAFYSAQIGC